MLSIDSGLDDMKDLPPPPPYDQVSMLQNFFQRNLRRYRHNLSQNHREINW